MAGRLLVNWRIAAAALIVMLALDAADVALYVGFSLASRAGAESWVYRPFFNMNHEFGLGECVEYAKSLLAAGAMLWCARRTSEPIFFALAAVNAWLAFDNAFTLHETVGIFLSRTILGGRAFGLINPNHAGEVVYLLAFGITVILLLGLALRGTSARMTPTGFLLALAVISPGVTGVFVDAFRSTPIAQSLSVAMLVIVEDGGETAMLSASCALSLGCLAHVLGWGDARRAAAEQRA